MIAPYPRQRRRLAARLNHALLQPTIDAAALWLALGAACWGWGWALVRDFASARADEGRMT